MDDQVTRILIVDDDEAVLGLYQLILGSAASRHRPAERRYQLTLCRQSEEAVEQVQLALEAENPFAVAFIDVRMPPGRPGTWAAEQIRCLDPYVNIVMVSGYSDADPRQVSELVPPANRLLYIQKPFHSMELKQLALALSDKWVAERQVLHANAMLDRRVEERTQELRLANDELVQEVAERRRAEEQLSKAERRYRALFESATDALFLLGSDGTFLEVNSVACERLGYDRQDMLMLSPDDIDDGVWGGVGMSLERLGEGYSSTMRTTHRQRDGQLVPVEVRSRVVEYEGGLALLSSARDITVQLGLQDQLRQASKMEAVGRLAGGIAHDFNNLVTAISGFSQMALASLDPAQPAHDDVCEIVEACQRASALVGKLMTFARRSEIDTRPIDMNQLLTGMTSMLRCVLGRGVSLSVRGEPGLPMFMADEVQMQQVIVNLIVNARDAMPGGGEINVSTRCVTLRQKRMLRSATLAPGDYVLLEVSDTGQGMTDDVLEHVFEPFFTTKEDGKGTGLGLSTVYGIVEQCGGVVDVRSALGVGTTFGMYFPVCDLDPDRYESDPWIAELEALAMA